MNLQITLNILQNRGWLLVHTSGKNCIYKNNEQYLIAPLRTTGRMVPSGTLDTMFRSSYKPRVSTVQSGNDEFFPSTVVPVVLEKQGNVLWGRIERQGLLVVTYGKTCEEIADQLHGAVAELKQQIEKQRPDLQTLSGGFSIDYQHDLTRVREFFRQVRLSYLSEQTGISQELLGEFMANKRYPSTQQAQQIENLIQRFGREMLNFSLF